MATMTIQHTDGKPIDEVVDYILKSFPELPKKVDNFSIEASPGVVAGARSRRSLKIKIEYDIERLDEKTKQEIRELRAYLDSLSADGVRIHLGK